MPAPSSWKRFSAWTTPAPGTTWGVLVSLVAVVSYTFIGGFLAVSRTDVFQALIMLAGVYRHTRNSHRYGQQSLSRRGIPSPPVSGTLLPMKATIPWASCFSFSSLGWALGAFGAHRILARFMAVDREENINRSRDVGMVWIVLIFGFGLLMGLVAAPALLDRGIMLPDAERLYLVVAEVFFHPIIAGLLLTAVIAAVMSTADFAAAISLGDSH